MQQGVARLGAREHPSGSNKTNKCALNTKLYVFVENTLVQCFELGVYRKKNKGKFEIKGWQGWLCGMEWKLTKMLSGLVGLNLFV